MTMANSHIRTALHARRDRNIVSHHPPARLPNAWLAAMRGAGKSSLLNALLDETCLLPTNGMRACTGGPTAAPISGCRNETRRNLLPTKFTTITAAPAIA